MAMPTPKRTPARIRFEPPSPNANVSPATTIATSERPRAMVLVKACCKTFTAFSHGEFPACAKAGEARAKLTTIAPRFRVVCLSRALFRQNDFIRVSLIQRLVDCEEVRRVLAVFVAGASGGTGASKNHRPARSALTFTRHT